MAKKPATTTTHTWAISRTKGTPAVEIGWVDAPDAETAIKEAISATASPIAKSNRSGLQRDA
jgi:hypothetical protein